MGDRGAGRPEARISARRPGAWLVIGFDASAGIMVAATLLLAGALQPVEHLIGGWKSLIDARSAWRRWAPASPTMTSVKSGRVFADRPGFRLALRCPLKLE